MQADTEDEEEVCPDCLCHSGDPGEWVFWFDGVEVIMCYCDCGCHEGMEP